MSNHTPGPWSACHDGACPCGQVWSKPADLPVAKVLREVADEFPSLRFVEGGEGSVAPQVEAYQDKIVYGGHTDEVASANARLISAAPDLLEALEKIATGYITGEYEHSMDASKVRAQIAQEAIAKARGET